MQTIIKLPIPEDHETFWFFIHNKGQMYFPKQDEAFGSYYFYKQMKKEDGKSIFRITGWKGHDGRN